MFRLKLHPHQTFLLRKTTGHLAGQPVAPLPSWGSRGCPSRDRCRVQEWLCLCCPQGLCLPLCTTPPQHGVSATTVLSRALLCGRGVGVDLGLWDPLAKSCAAPPRSCELGVVDTLRPAMWHCPQSEEYMSPGLAPLPVGSVWLGVPTHIPIELITGCPCTLFSPRPGARRQRGRSEVTQQGKECK